MVKSRLLALAGILEYRETKFLLLASTGPLSARPDRRLSHKTTILAKTLCSFSKALRDSRVSSGCGKQEACVARAL